MKELKLSDGRDRLVRHGHGPERSIQTGIGLVAVSQVKTRDSEPAAERRIRFTSAILPLWARRTKSLEAMQYALSRWRALSLYIDDGRVEIDNNIAEWAIRPIGIGRKNWLFAGSDKGGERIANILTIIETAKMHGHSPKDYLTDVLTRIKDHPKDRIHELLPWNWSPRAAKPVSWTKKGARRSLTPRKT